MQKPHEVLNRMFPEFNYETSDNVLKLPDELLKNFDLIIFCRRIQDLKLVEIKLGKLGIPFAMDIDDYWHLPEDHISYELYKEFNESETVEKCLQASLFVITTTEILAEKIKPFNQNVHVIENGIDSEDPIWKPNKIKSRRTRFGFTQGSAHYPDIELISKDVQKCFDDEGFLNYAQIVLSGFNAKFNEQSVYVGYEKLLTNDLKIKGEKKYVNSLKRLASDINGINKPYRRIWGKDIDQYASVYDEMDLIVVPLKENDFNSCKSELKMIEAGFKDCAVIVHHVKPYTLLATDKNSFDLNKKSFYEWQKYLLLNPNAIEDSKARLREDVRKYDLKLLSEMRASIYKIYMK